MNSEHVTIRKIERSEIQQLKNFPPPDWNLDIPAVFSFHFEHSYFYPIVAEVGDTLIGCGISIFHGSINWLGTIIVLPDYRRKGIGQSITEHLIDYGRKRGCETHILTASEMGEPIYRRLGFKTDLDYEFYRRPPNKVYLQDPQVRKIQQEDFDAVKNLDKQITGEDRGSFIERFFPTGWVFDSKISRSIEGAFLPEYGTGLVIAETPEAGIELMKKRFIDGKESAIIPSTNTAAREWLRAEGFRQYRTAPRMVLGKDINWHPPKLYNRGTGYCG